MKGSHKRGTYLKVQDGLGLGTHHDIFLRAYAVQVGRKRKRKHKLDIRPKWSRYGLVFDTETQITADQSLTFGVYRFCELVGGSYKVTEEGIFYADNLPANERKVLQSYVHTSVSDVASFPPRFPLYSRSEFMKRVFWPVIKRRGALVCGFNLPFDLARLAVDWGRGEKDEWSLVMSQYANGNENRNYPRVLITPIDSKKAFIKLAKPWKPKEWTEDGNAHFLDLRTFGWALFNESFSLKSACKDLKTEHQKDYHDPTGEVTHEEIEYARQDVRCTVDVLNALKLEFDKHPIDLKPDDAYSPASVAKSYLDKMGIIRPALKFDISDKVQGIAMQTYYGGRSETRIRCQDVPVVPVDFKSEYPSCCALMGLFEVLKARSLSFEDDTENIKRFLKGITLDRCFNRGMWRRYKFFALVKPDGDILPVRTVYNEITQNIGNNYLTSDRPLWFAGPDLIASIIRTGKVPQIVRAIRLVPHGKQAGMQSVNLRGMVKVDPYKDDLFCKIIEQRDLHQNDKAIYYWLKILANSIYGFFVELNPEIQKKNIAVNVFSGERHFHDQSDVIEKPGPWFFPPLASLITAGGRLLLAMTEALVKEKRGTYLFCDTDSLAIVASKRGGRLSISGSSGLRILSRTEVENIVDRFAALNPYNPEIVRGSILNLIKANFVDSDPKKARRQLYGYSVAAKRYALYEKIDLNNIKIVDPKAHGIGFLYPPKDSPDDWEEDVPLWIYEMWDYIVRGAFKLRCKAPPWLDLPQMMRLTITTYKVLHMLGEWEIARPYNFLFLPMVDPTFGYAFFHRANEKVLLVTPFSSKQGRWFELECTNIYTGKTYKMVDCTKEKNPAYDVVFPSQFARLLIDYQEHPEAKSLAPDGGPCEADTRGLLQRVHVVAGKFRYVGKETDRKWEEGDDISVLEFKTTEYGRAKRIITDASTINEIRAIGVRKTMALTKMSQHTIEKLLHGESVKRKTYEHVLKAIQAHKSK
jgi:hypothetical protein